MFAEASLAQKTYGGYKGARLHLVGEYRGSRVEVYQRRPSDYRESLVRGERSRVLSFDGDAAWVHSGFPPHPVRLPPLTAAVPRDEHSDFDGALVDHRHKGHEVELLGDAEVDGAPVFHLGVTLASGTVQEWFLSRESFLVVKKTTPASHPERGEYQRAYFYQSYRNYGGLLLPDSVESEDQERIRAFEWTETEVDVRLDDSLFTGVSLTADQPTRGEP